MCLVDLAVVVGRLVRLVIAVLGRVAVPYRVPNFNLFCNIGPSAFGDNTWPPAPYFGAPRLAHKPCALVYGKRVNMASSGGTDDQGFPATTMTILFPKLTDVRSVQSTDQIPDTIECPEGSGRWYGVCGVDDIGKGYANEHRVAWVQPLAGEWTVPYA